MTRGANLSDVHELEPHFDFSRDSFGRQQLYLTLPHAGFWIPSPFSRGHGLRGPAPVKTGE